MAVAAAPAQTAPGVKNVYAFLKLHQPGNIAADPEGRPLQEGPDTLYTVYVETDRPDIEWKKAYVNGRIYAITCSPVGTTPFRVGAEKRSGRKIFLSASKGNRLWQLDLGVTNEKPVHRQKITPGEIILEGKKENRKIIMKVSVVVELREIPSA